MQYIPAFLKQKLNCELVLQRRLRKTGLTELNLF